jgi:glutaredoxin
MIYVYTQPGCVPCKYAIAHLERSNTDFEVIDIHLDGDAYRYVTEDKKAKSTPVIEREDSEGRSLGVIFGYAAPEQRKLREWIELENPNQDEDGIWLD